MRFITKEQADYLIKKGYLKQEKGRFPDLSITSRQKPGKRKKRYIPDNLYERHFGENKKTK